MSLQTILEDLYKLEVNVQISCFYDNGWLVKLGDEINGFDQSKSCDTLEEVTEWLHLKYQTISSMHEDDSDDD